MFKNTLCALALGLFALVGSAHAQNQSILDAAQDNPDFAIQGEYSGQIEGQEGVRKYGAQVVALGEHKFHAVVYIGGLPGDGWNGTDKWEADGQLVDGQATFAFENGTGKIKDGLLTGYSPDGTLYGSLKKITRKSPSLGQKAPEGAVVLFDGKDGSQWKPGKTTPDGLTTGKTGGQSSIPTFQSCSLHLEFMLPFEPKGRGQGRSNSGVYFQGRYEVQILDSFGLKGLDNECGGVYRVGAPKVNMCFPPLTWQTYDIDFTAAQFDPSGKKLKNARLTVRHNGVLIQDDIEVPGATTAAPRKDGPEAGPIYLQDHGHPVAFRNIWVVEKK